MTTGVRKINDFCWINLMTPGGERAAQFFSRLFGWTYGAMPGVIGGRLIQVEGRTAGALMDLDRVALPHPTPPSIGVMVRVADVDAVSARVTALGGRGEPAFDVLENGRMAVCFDPNGAEFDIWQSRKEVGSEADSMAHGAPTWFDTLTTDAGRAVSFYSALFGWVPEVTASATGMHYTVFKLDGSPVAGAMALPPNMAGVPPHWATSFATLDADQTARRAVELGGHLCMEVQPIPDVGRFAMIQSPEGVPFYILEHKA